MTKSQVKGFTLSELMIAAAILALVLSALLILYINCLFLNEASRNLSIATSHAQYMLEEIKYTSFATIAPNYNGVCINDGSIESRGLSPLTAETICTTVTGTRVLNVSVVVSWEDKGMRNRGLTLATLITEP